MQFAPSHTDKPARRNTNDPNNTPTTPPTAGFWTQTHTDTNRHHTNRQTPHRSHVGAPVFNVPARKNQLDEFLGRVHGTAGACRIDFRTQQQKLCGLGPTCTTSTSLKFILMHIKTYNQSTFPGRCIPTRPNAPDPRHS